MSALDRQIWTLSTSGPKVYDLDVRRGHAGDRLDRLLEAGVGHIGHERELARARVVDGDGLGVLRRLDHGGHGAELAILGVHAELGRDVRRGVPQLDLSMARASIAGDFELHALDGLLADVPRLERVALDAHRLRGRRDIGERRSHADGATARHDSVVRRRTWRGEEVANALLEEASSDHD